MAKRNVCAEFALTTRMLFVQNNYPRDANHSEVSSWMIAGGDCLKTKQQYDSTEHVRTGDRQVAAAFSDTDELCKHPYNGIW